ncbi:Glucose-1-phosphate thymidylyltransferase [hydrothermal vent metagenome]|uniref:Glucose-1-phosphate thymidylyltransferase n=1 Tax=hydrothermal vent metagenome TaxID=652676 RepID=A0A1W1BM71_9ZZZZ
MTAMILAAGLGTRMRPLTNDTPKPLLKVGGKPLIVWHIERLKESGITDIVINVSYLGYKIIEYLGDGSKYGVKIQFSDEQEEGALETAGGVIKALPFLSDTFLVINGDIWTDFSYKHDFCLDDELLAHLVLVDNPEHNPSGDFFLTDTSKKYTFSGIGYYSKKMFSDLNYGKQALAPLLFEAIDAKKLTTEYYTGAWHDIGTPARLEFLERQLSENVL